MKHKQVFSMNLTGPIDYGFRNDYMFRAALHCGSILDLFAHDELNHHTTVTGGVLQEECSALLKAFFAERRKKAKALREENS